MCVVGENDRILSCRALDYYYYASDAHPVTRHPRKVAVSGSKALDRGRHEYYVIYILPKTNTVSTEAVLKTNWFHIMLSLAEGGQHGYGIMQDVLERTDGRLRLWPATLYGSLRRLTEEGLIEEGPSGTDVDARRRSYRLTAKGRAVLSAEIRRLETLLRAARGKRRSLDMEPST